MKKLFITTLLLACASIGASAQEPSIGMIPGMPKIDVTFNEYVPAPAGFDQSTAGIAKGTIEEIEYPSKTVGTNRKCTVYLPPKYDSKKKYPVLYLLHGIGGDHVEWLNGASPNVIMDNIYAQNKAVPMIIVMPNGRALKDDRTGQYIWSRHGQRL